MATESILKNVTLDDKKASKEFIVALETAKDKKGKKVMFSRNVSNISGDKVKDFFGEK